MPFNYGEARKYGMIFRMNIVVVLVKVQFNHWIRATSETIYTRGIENMQIL